MSTNNIEIRNGDTGDLARLVEIYNHYITETHITFHTEPFVVGARTQWFTQFSDTGPHRLLIVEQKDEVIGYASSTQFKPRSAYDQSVETTIYLGPEHVGEGLGTRLYGALLDELIADASVHRAYGGTALPNPQAIALHERLGFKRVGTYREVGFKFDKYWDVSWFEKDVSE